MSTKSKYYPQLTGLRGFAILLVFFSHCDMHNLLPIKVFGSIGVTGVVLFFMLSGFLMGDIYLNKKPDGAELKSFTLSRMGRVFPLYLMLVALCIFVLGFFPKLSLVGGYSEFITLETKLESIFFIRSPGIFWTVPVEVQFYMLFIGIWFFTYKMPSNIKRNIIIGLTLVSVLLNFMYKEDKSILTYSLIFMLGVLISMFKEKLFAYAQAYHKTYVQVIILLLFLINIPSIRNKLGVFVELYHDIFFLSINALFFISILLGNRFLKALENKFFVFLGEISYGFYLLHWLMINFVLSFSLSNNYLTIASSFVLSIGISYLSFNFFEKPTLKLFKNKIRV